MQYVIQNIKTGRLVQGGRIEGAEKGYFFKNRDAARAAIKAVKGARKGDFVLGKVEFDKEPTTAEAVTA